MQLELEVPERLVRKLKALNALEGGLYAASIEAVILDMMEATVNRRILELMGIGTPKVEGTHEPVSTTKEAPRYVASFEDSSGIADGLGDDDDDFPSPETDEEALVPTGGLTDHDLDEDMLVTDPEHEAKEDAPEFPDNVQSDQIFSRVVGIPLPVDEGEEHPVVARRRRKSIGKAKVRPMTEEYETSSF